MKTRACLCLVLLAVCAGAQIPRRVLQDSLRAASAGPIHYSYPAPDYTTWLLDTNMFAVPTNTWGGNWVWDQASSLWRSVAVNNSENAIYQYTSVDGYTSSAPTVAISPGTWDTSLGVPFIWNEAGQTRPWRMFYSNAGAKMGLATSLDGATWDKKDTAGNVLSAAVLNPAGTADFGSVFKVGSTYYLYWDTITPPRNTYLATSSDLVNWTQVDDGQSDKAYWWGGTNAAGTWDYDDAAHSSLGRSQISWGSSNGYFCPWTGRWDRPDGTVEYRAYIPTCTDNAGYAYTCWTSASPDFRPANRTYRGMFLSTSNAFKLGGIAMTKMDVPRLYCDDVFQNPVTSTLAANTMWAGAYLSPNWFDGRLIRPSGVEVPMENTATTGGSLSNVTIVASNSPALTLQLITGDSNTVYQFEPGHYRSMADLAGYGVSVCRSGAVLSGAGVALNRVQKQYLLYAPPSHLSQMDRVTNDFTIEFSASKNAVLGAGGIGAMFEAGGDSGQHICYVYLTGSSGDTAVTWTLALTDTGSTTRTFVSPSFDWSGGESHAWCFSRKSGTLYWFKDGTLQNSGGSAFNYVIKTTTGADPLGVGISATATTTYTWPGTIDELRLSSTNRYSATYTPSFPYPMSYATNGYVFTRVYDFGSSVPGASCLVSATVPALTAVAVTHRSAASATDKSVDPTAFGASASGQWHQFCIRLTGNGAVTPLIKSVVVRSP